MSQNPRPHRSYPVAWGALPVIYSLLICGIVSAEEPPKPSDKQPQAANVVTGQVTYAGEIPLAPIANAAGTRRPLLTVDKRTGGLRNAVVSLTMDEGAAGVVPQVPPTDGLPAAVVDQIDETFVPRVVAVRAGQAVEFRNSDGGNHNVRAASTIARNEFNTFTGPGGKYEHQFAAHPKERPVLIGCDIHPWMRAWVFVFEHPYFTVTDEAGRFMIENVPPGSYTLRVRQPDGGLSHDERIHVSSTKSSRVSIRFTNSDLAKSVKSP